MHFLKFPLMKACVLAVFIFFLKYPVPLSADTNSSKSKMITDTENCLFCHRYPSMGRYDKTGKRRIFYLNDRKFASSVHGKLGCKSCHVGLNEIPHTDVKKVDCSTNCHLKEPSTNKDFSHANMINKYKLSVHGNEKPGKIIPFPEDLPTCKYCHDNRMYSSLKIIGKDNQALFNETVGRCAGCHTKKEWADSFYVHFTHRMKKRRTQKEVVILCTSCHEDKEKMARHGLESIETYKDTFHWKQVKYKVENAPDCITCHVTPGHSIHELRPQADPLSPVNMGNRIQTCSRQGGVQECHPGATKRFSTGRVHAYGAKAKLVSRQMKKKDTIKVDVSSTPLLLKRAKKEIQPKELFHYTILRLLKIFYRILIAGVIGFMCLHQFLEYLRSRKNHRDS